MVTPGREAVIENIKEAVSREDYNAKVEVGDPVLTTKQKNKILKKYLHVREKAPFKIRNWAAGRAADVLTWKLNKDTEIVGLEKVKDIKGQAFITSNHFNPIENTSIRLLSQKLGRGNLYVISQDTNLSMGGFFGFFMYYMDIIPITRNKSYMRDQFDRLIDEAFKRKQFILVYPEQEMWFNYRKPRPPKRGAYYYAAKHNAPIISCFNEIVDLPEKETDDFYQTKYILHVLDPIYPDPAKTVRENSFEMMQKDYEQKKAAYEEIYHKPLDYTFTDWDIAGWIPKREV